MTADSKHPCYDKNAHDKWGRIHLPVAPACNIACGYCNRKTDCVNESRPGVTSQVLNPQEALSLVKKAQEAMPTLSVVGIAGPGDPLANPDNTLETLRLVRNAAPNLMLCLSSNGLALPEYVNELADLGVGHITITLNAVAPKIGARLYAFVSHSGGRKSGEEGAALLLDAQTRSLEALRRRGITVKINTVIVPGINDTHAVDIAEYASRYGAALMNCIGMIPVSDTPLQHVAAPTHDLMKKVRTEAGKYMLQMTHCGRCRADAFGLIAEQTTISSLLDHTHSQPVVPITASRASNRNISDMGISGMGLSSKGIGQGIDKGTFKAE